VDADHLVMTSFFYDDCGVIRPFITEQFPNGLFIDDVCPYAMPWQGPTPRTWMRDNLTGYAIRWKDGFHFNVWSDAFAFKLAWT
jgi:hypothetical protein